MALLIYDSIYKNVNGSICKNVMEYPAENDANDANTESGPGKQ